MKKNAVLLLTLILSSACTLPNQNVPEAIKSNTPGQIIPFVINSPAELFVDKSLKSILQKDSLEITAGESFSLTTDLLLPAGLQISDFNFIVSDNTLMSIFPDGKISAFKEGKVTVRIELKDNSEKFTEYLVNILPAKEENKTTPLSVGFLNLNSDLTLNPGQSFSFSAFVTYSDQKTDANILWSVSDSFTAEINRDGLLKALKPGKIDVIASSRINPKVTKALSVTIKQAPVNNPIFISDSSSKKSLPPVDLNQVKNEILFYDQDPLDKNKVYIFNGDGTNLRHLLLPFVEVKQVSLSPSENNLLFVADGAIRTVNIDGSSLLAVRETNAAGIGNPIFSPDSLKILYTGEELGNKNLYLSAFHGSNFEKISESGLIDSGSFLLDNLNFVFIQDGQFLKKMDKYEQNPVLLQTMTNISDPVVSPDGNKIAFIQHSADLTANLFTLNIDGTELKQVTDNEIGSAIEISKILKWSKNSEYIFYLSNEKGEGVFVSKADGSAETKLNISFASSVLCCDRPTGKIVYVSDKEGSDKTYLKNYENNSELKLADIAARFANIFTNLNYYLLALSDGIYFAKDQSVNLAKIPNTDVTSSFPEWTPDLRVLFNSDNHFVVLSGVDGAGAMAIPLGNPVNGHFEMSPDGAKVLYTSIKVAEVNRHIYTMNNNTSNKVQLTTDGDNSNPSWSRDGQKIVFDSNRSGQREIWIMNADGSVQQTLTDFGASTPRWSPDGKKIAFNSEKDGKKAIYLINSDGTGLEKLMGDTLHNYQLKFWN